MVDQLPDLLNREASGLEVPAPRLREVLARGRRMRRRRGLTVAGAGVAAALVVAGGIGVGTSLLGGDGSPEPAGDPAPDLGAVFAVGSTVYIHDGVDSVSFDGRGLTSLHYTSAGMVVRHDAASGSGSDSLQRLSLVTDAGDVESLAPIVDRGHLASDPTQPLMAWTERENGLVVAVVWNVEEDVEVARIVVRGASGRNLPVSLDGDRVYVGGSEVRRSVDLRTGETEVAPLVDYSAVVAGGLTTGTQGATPQVRDVDTGEVVLEGSSELSGGSGYGLVPFALSPDGRSAAIAWFSDSGSLPTTFEVYAVATGEHVTIDGQIGDFAWTADGGVFRVRGDTVTTCDAQTGDCDDQAIVPTVPRGADVLVAGGIYGS